MLRLFGSGRHHKNLSRSIFLVWSLTVLLTFVLFSACHLAVCAWNIVSSNAERLRPRGLLLWLLYRCKYIKCTWSAHQVLQSPFFFSKRTVIELLNQNQKFGMEEYLELSRSTKWMLKNQRNGVHLLSPSTYILLSSSQCFDYFSFCSLIPQIFTVICFYFSL